MFERKLTEFETGLSDMSHGLVWVDRLQIAKCFSNTTFDQGTSVGILACYHWRKFAGA